MTLDLVPEVREPEDTVFQGLSVLEVPEADDPALEDREPDLDLV